MNTFNLSRWALEHKSFVVYLMLIVALAGIFEYRHLGRDEDPPFTIKTMVVKTLWPGATTTETMQQVTDRIEKKLEELPNIDYQKSYTKPGESVVFVYLKDSTPASEVPDLWYQVRKKIGDIKQTLPQGVQGPFFNDEFGDTYALIFALTELRIGVPSLHLCDIAQPEEATIDPEVDPLQAFLRRELAGHAYRDLLGFGIDAPARLDRILRLQGLDQLGDVESHRGKLLGRELPDRFSHPAYREGRSLRHPECSTIRRARVRHSPVARGARSRPAADIPI
jgi:hypothetical protein